MNKKVLVLGAGRVGTAIALDLSDNYKVVVVDAHAEALTEARKVFKKANRKVGVTLCDCTDIDSFKSLAKYPDLIINALPGAVGFFVLKNSIQWGKNIIDISFAPEDPLTLKDVAKKAGVTAIVDCGIAPGLSNMIAGFHYGQMKMNSFSCRVGGLPKKKSPPFNYKAPFSPIDVLAEYIRPARFMEQGRVVTKKALSDIENIVFEGIGELEAFNTDGLRTLLKTLKVPFMWEKTLRYPGHAEQMKFLRNAGFFDSKSIKAGDTFFSPIEVTTRLLLSHWKYAPGEEDLTLMRIVVDGEEDSEKVLYTYTLYDEYDQKTKMSSMARTTGFTCTAVARLLLEGKIKQTGLVTPEELGMDHQIFDEVVNYLRSKNISLDIKKVTFKK
ncbi:MAG: saccharopine dehydrogenase C-terminal domain-containing protein [bacterium]|nr:saccharopine dehydrogenase C-terminal domain-containing protein [bacterium]